MASRQNGLGSTPYNFATGGTDFSDTFNSMNSAYWRKTNSATGESAKSYVPEMTWDDSCAGSVLFSFLGFPNGLSLCNTGNFLEYRWRQRRPQLRLPQAFLAICSLRRSGRRQT
jgi:hypothetical protein